MTNTGAKEAAESYTREQLATTERFAGRRDLVMAVLDAGKTYTLEAAEKAVEGFLRKKVK